MLDYFVDGLQLNFKNMSMYKGTNKIKPISYLLILVLAVTIILLFFNLSKIKIDDFILESRQSGLSVKNGSINLTEEAMEEFNRNSENTGIRVTENGLDIRNVGIMSFQTIGEMTGDFKMNLGEVLSIYKGQFMNILFLTMYLKTFPFLFLSFLVILLSSFSLKKAAFTSNLTKTQILEIISSLITLPSLIYLVLRAINLSNSMSLLLFVVFFVIMIVCFTRYYTISIFGKKGG